MMENNNRNHRDNVNPLTYTSRRGVYTRARSHQLYEEDGLSAYMGFDMWWRWVEDHLPFPDDIWLSLSGIIRVHSLIEGHPYPHIDDEFFDDGVDETINSDDDNKSNDDIDNNISNNEVDDVSDDDDDDDDDVNSNGDIEWARCDGDDCNNIGFLQLNVIVKASFKLRTKLKLYYLIDIERILYH